MSKQKLIVIAAGAVWASASIYYFGLSYESILLFLIGYTTSSVANDGKIQ